jgi:hypothetical protein
MNNILMAMNNKLLVEGIFCDLQKAFDCVNRKILTDKLEFCGIEGKFKTLIESYLMGIYQRAVVGNRIDSSNLSRMASSAMLRRVALVRTDVSEELSASFIRVTRIGELVTTLAVTSN